MRGDICIKKKEKEKRIYLWVLNNKVYESGRTKNGNLSKN